MNLDMFAEEISDPKLDVLLTLLVDSDADRHVWRSPSPGAWKYERNKIISEIQEEVDKWFV